MKRIQLAICFSIILVLTACVSSIDGSLPYTDLPTITVGAEVALATSPTHPNAHQPGNPIPAGAVVQVLGTNDDNSWLLVRHNERLGWMPTFFSRTNVSTLNAAIVITPLDSSCTAFLSYSEALDNNWRVGSPGAAIVQGILYRSQMGDGFDNAALSIAVVGDGDVTAADYIHAALTADTGLILFSAALDGLDAESQLRLGLADAGDEPLGFQAALYSNSCPEQIDASAGEFTDLLPVGAPRRATPQGGVTRPGPSTGRTQPEETGSSAPQGEILAEILSVRSGPGFAFDFTGERLRGAQFAIRGRVCGGPGGYDWLLIESESSGEAWIPGAPHLVKTNDLSALTCRAAPAPPAAPVTTVTIQRAGTLLASKLITEGAEAADYLATVTRYRLAMKAAVALPNSPALSQLADYAEGTALEAALNEVRQLRARQLAGELTVTQLDARFIALYDIGKATLLVDEVHTLVRQRALASGSQPVEIELYEGPVVYRMTYRAGFWRVSEVVLLNTPTQAQAAGSQKLKPGPADEGDYLQKARTLLAERNAHQVSLDVLLPIVDTSAYLRPSGNMLEGRIRENTLLEKALGPYVLQRGVTVDQGITLYIEPGTVVKFANGVTLEIYGSLIARGTREQRIIFTSLRDDFAGGDTNADQGSSAPLPGDWGAIRFRNESNDAGSVIEQAVIRYAGWDGAIYLDAASPTLVNNIFEQNRGYAISGDPSSFPAISGNLLAENGGNGMQIRDGDLRSSGAWRSTDMPYIITGRITINEGTTLNVEPGVVVKFGAGVNLDVNGSLRAVGSADEPIVFTSYKDDTVGGDANGDQISSAPTPGDWGAIRFRDSSNDASSIIEQAIIRYAGWDGAIYLEGASPQLVDNFFENNLRNAISGDPHSFPVAKGNRLSGNGGNGLQVRDGEMRISGAWSNTDIPYIITGRVTVAQGATLTISPGVLAKFGNGVSLDISGALRAIGAPDAQIAFTSLQDDTLAGDTNGDQSSSSPTRGDWGALRFRDTSNDESSIVEHAIFRYAGWDGAVYLESASPTIAGSLFEENLHYAVSGDPHSFPTVRGNRLVNNGGNGLQIRGGEMRMSGTWDNEELPYVLLERLTVNEGATLTVNPGVVVKLGNGAAIDVNGAFRAAGISDKPIVFTSLKDDTIAGDTNGDEASSAPAPGDWGAVRFRDRSNDANSVIEQAVLRYAGWDGAVYVEAASPTIINNAFENNIKYGIWYDANSAPRLDENVFSGNREGDIFQATR